jgi:hypothetical protein
MNGLALQVQEALRRDPHAGDLFVFRGAHQHPVRTTSMSLTWCIASQRVRIGFDHLDELGEIVHATCVKAVIASSPGRRTVRRCLSGRYRN